MNIMLLTTHLNAGGITSYLYLLSQGLREQGHNIFLVSGGGERADTFSAIGVHVKNMNIRTKSEADPRIYIAAWQLKEYIRENNIDLIHAHTRITQVMGQLLRSWTKKIYLSTCHGYFTNRLSRRIAPCWGDKVIAISEAVATHLQEDFHVPQEKILIIHNGIDIKRFPLITESTKCEARKKYNISGGPIVGIIARLSDVKGHDLLIWAMSHIVSIFPSSKLVIVGKGKEEERLQQLSKELKVQDHVIFLPMAGKPTEMLPLFDVFILPSYKEGLALALIEAQASGLPVVATRVGGIPEVVLHNKTGLLVEPGNIDDLARAILSLLKDKEYAREIGIRAHELVAQKFNADRMVKKTIQVYENAVSGKLICPDSSNKN